jgi:hypothetical protein
MTGEAQFLSADGPRRLSKDQNESNEQQIEIVFKGEAIVVVRKTDHLSLAGRSENRHFLRTSRWFCP